MVFAESRIPNPESRILLISLLQAFQSYPALFVTAVVVLSLAVGSFLNVVIYRLPKVLIRDWRHQSLESLIEWAGEKDAPLMAKELRAPVTELCKQIESGERYNLVMPRSRCPSCGHKISAHENIPILSWLWLRGRCSQCKTRISVRYPFVEALTGALSGYVAWRYGLSIATLAGLIFVWSMIALSFIDFDTTYLPDDITQPLLWLGIVFSFANIFANLPSAIVGAAAGYFILWTVSKVWNVIRNVESMGHGDFKLLAVIGAWFGWEMLPQAILISSFIGAMAGLGLMAVGRGDLSTKIPFGPYLAIAGVLAMLHGPAINQYYLRLL